jgi:hypothetical protein
LKTFLIICLWIHVVFMNFNIKFESFWQNIRVRKGIFKRIRYRIFFTIYLGFELYHVLRRKLYFLKTTSWTSTWFSWLNFNIWIGKILKLRFYEKHILTIFLISIFVLIVGNVDFIIIIILIAKLERLLYIFLIFKFFDYLLKIEPFFKFILLFINNLVIFWIFNIIIIINLKFKLIIFFIFLIFIFVSARKHADNIPYILKNWILVFLLLFFIISWFLKLLRRFI